MPYLGFSAKNDITINATSDLELTSDNTTIKFGADDDVTITHDPDDGLIFKSIATADDNPFLLTIQTGETDLAANDVIGKIQFQAPDEGTGTDANLVSAAIQAVAEGDFSSSSNATSLQFMTGSSEAAATKMTILSSGNVGIGDTSPTKPLTLGTTTPVMLFDDQSSRTMEIRGPSTTHSATILTTYAADLLLGTNSTERMRIDSSGRVGIGGTPNTNWRDDIANQEVLMLGTEATFFSDSGVTTELWNNSYVDDSDTFKNISERGASRYYQYQGAHKWFTAASASAGSTISTEINSTPKMTLDISGTLLVGRTADGDGTAGAMMRGSGFIQSTRDGNLAADFNRLSSDGDIVRFQKASSPVGTIGANAGYLKISSGNSSFGSGIEFHNLKSIPVGANGAASDGTVNLGDTDRRWNNIYLAGGVYVGGTGSANYLDDYEEGTWTPSVSGSGSLSGTSPSLSGRYIKIGDFVSIKLTITNSAGDLQVSSFVGISGVPFSFSESAQGVVLTEDIDVFARQGFASCSGTNIFLSACGSSSGTTALIATVSGRI